ncbi:MAG: TolC family protein [Dysgonamonadaceae bacterium]|jgi:outer membrane protein TolC|nr:TolC family protein [Dysgonamonadaceae bacterium]
MNRKAIPLFIALSLGINVYSQLSIEDCHARATENYPLIRQYGLIELSHGYGISNVNKAWLPQINFSSKASIQSDVTKIPLDFSQIPIPQIQEMQVPEMNRDQYLASLEVTQTIYDGGTSKARRKQIKLQSDASKAELEVNLYSLKERINQLYFGILLLDALMEQNLHLQGELQQNIDKVSSYIKNGLANKEDVDAVKVELLKAKQGYIKIKYSRKSYLQMLAAFIGEPLNDDVTLQKPGGELPNDNVTLQKLSGELPNPAGILRPELFLFDTQIKALDATNLEIKSDLMPKLALFLSGGYGNPGLDMLKEGFTTYLIGGVKLSWNIGNLYTVKNRQNILKTNKNSILVQRETFIFNTSLQKTEQETEIDKLRAMLESDDEIITLRNYIKQTVEAKVANGTANVNDLIHEITAEESAILDKIMHEIEMLHAIYNLKFITNN